MSAPHAWEGVATEVSAAVAVAVEPTVRKAADDFYEHLMTTVQDYLADNIAFNIASTLAAAERGRWSEWGRAEKAERIGAALLEALQFLLSEVDLAQQSGAHAASVDCIATLKARKAIALATGAGQ